MSIQNVFEKFAMRAEEVAQSEGRKWLDVDEVGAGLGVSPHESRILAELMCDHGWATALEVDGKMKIRLVKHGFDEIAKLRWPAWRRWIDRHPRLVGCLYGAAIGLATAVLGAVLIEYAKRLVSAG